VAIHGGLKNALGGILKNTAVAVLGFGQGLFAQVAVGDVLDLHDEHRLLCRLAPGQRDAQQAPDQAAIAAQIGIFRLVDRKPALEQPRHHRRVERGAVRRREVAQQAAAELVLAIAVATENAVFEGKRPVLCQRQIDTVADFCPVFGVDDIDKG